MTLHFDPLFLHMQSKLLVVVHDGDHAMVVPVEEQAISLKHHRTNPHDLPVGDRLLDWVSRDHLQETESVHAHQWQLVFGAKGLQVGRSPFVLLEERVV